MNALARSFLAAAALAAFTTAAHAQDAGARQADAAAPADGLWQRATLFGEMGGLRPAFDTYGVTLTLQETGEYLANLAGGTRRLGAYDGLTQATVSVDTSKLIGLPGGTVNVSALQIHGTSLTARALGAQQMASGLEADAGTRLWELWYGQQLAGGALDLRVGQQSVDQEFMVSQYAASFVNATFGWPVLPSVDMPGGGPAYPLSSLGVRAKAQPTAALTLLAGVFDGYPGGLQGDPQRVNPHGTRFGLLDGALWIGEAQYAINQAAADARPDARHAPGLPGTYRLGLWYLSGRFDDTGSDANGLAQTHRGNYGIYAIGDQMLWRSPSYAARSLGVFARVMGAPGDRDSASFSAQGGITLKAPFAGRDNDTTGIAVGYTNALPSVGAALGGLAGTRIHETVIEASYQYQVAPWWTLQGDLQYIARPNGGHALQSDGALRAIRNEFVAGLRTVVNF